MNRFIKILLSCFVISIIATIDSNASRIKDITELRGVRNNDLIGYGLVIGLTGTGDSYNKSTFTIQALISMLNRQGIRIPPEKFNSIQVKNIASVMVTAKIPPFSKKGNKIDVTVSSIGDAKSIQGGTLLMTPLKAVNGEVYAIAQGSLSIGGFEADSQGSSIRKNHITVGRIPNGATVEREVSFHFSGQEKLVFNLKKADFMTVSRIVKTINLKLRGIFATADDSRTIEVAVPNLYRDKVVQLIATIEALDVTPDQIAKVVLNERTGTIIMGNEVRISKIAISHGALVIRIDTEKDVSQPNPMSQGETTTTEESKLTIDEEDARLVIIEDSVSLADVVEGLNALGVTPRDLISILQAIKSAGALKAELEII